MKLKSWCGAALMGALALAVTGTAFAQSEMTSKIRLECAGTDASCAGPAAQFDFGVDSGILSFTKVTDGDQVRFRHSTSLDIPVLAVVGGPPTGVANLLRLSATGTGGVQFLLDRASGNDWQFSNFGSAFQISVPGNNASIFNVTAGGDIQVSNKVFANGVQLTSSRVTKENFTPVDGGKVLAALRDLPITQWNFKADPAKESHIGPTAEDFQSAFGVGQSTSISVTDANGIILKALQALQGEVEAKDKQIAELSARQAELMQRIQALEQK